MSKRYHTAIWFDRGRRRAGNRDLVVYDKAGKLWTVRYDAVNVMLLNEFLKEHQKVQEQQASIADLKSTVALQQKGMEALTAQLKSKQRKSKRRVLSLS